MTPGWLPRERGGQVAEAQLRTLPRQVPDPRELFDQRLAVGRGEDCEFARPLAVRVPLRGVIARAVLLEDDMRVHASEPEGVHGRAPRLSEGLDPGARAIVHVH